MAAATLDYDRLLKLRLVVARVGEMGNAGWWNTKGQLGSWGAKALARGFPRTHDFAQARAVFAVAAARCAEVFDPPASATLWKLPPEIEEEFDARWEHWLDDHEAWRPFFEKVQAIEGADVIGSLVGLGALTPAEAEGLGKLRRSAEGKAVALPGLFAPTDEVVGLLAIGFARGEAAAPGKPGAPAIPYARLEG